MVRKVYFLKKNILLYIFIKGSLSSNDEIFQSIVLWYQVTLVSITCIKLKKRWLLKVR